MGQRRNGAREVCMLRGRRSQVRGVADEIDDDEMDDLDQEKRQDAQSDDLPVRKRARAASANAEQPASAAGTKIRTPLLFVLRRSPSQNKWYVDQCEAQPASLPTGV